jgi:hypothetical protein
MSRVRLRRLMLIVALGIGAAGAPPAAAASRPSIAPAEGISRFVARYRAAVAALQARDCAKLAAFNRSTGYPIPCNDLARQLLGNFRIVGYAQFGTGALVDFVDNEAPRGATAIFGVGPNRRFQVFTEQILGRGEVGTRATPARLTRFSSAARAAVLAVQRRNCTVFFNTWYTGPLTRAEACRQAFSPAGGFHRELAADPAAQPERIGGTSSIQFYRLWTKGHYRTLVVARFGRTTESLYVTDSMRMF